MERTGGLIERIALAMAGKRSPWGKGPSSGDEDNSGGETPPPSGEAPKGPRNPWLPGGGDGDDGRKRRSASIEDIFRHRGPEGPRRGPGGGFRLPDAPGGRGWFPLAIGAIAILWLAVTTTHQIGPKEEGIVTTFGKYSSTLHQGLNWTLPWPIQHVDVENVSEFRIEQIPEGSGQRLMVLTAENGSPSADALRILTSWAASTTAPGREVRR